MIKIWNASKQICVKSMLKRECKHFGFYYFKSLVKELMLKKEWYCYHLNKIIY